MHKVCCGGGSGVSGGGGGRDKILFLDACKWEGGERVEVVLSGVNHRLNKEKALHYQGVPFVITV